MAFNVCPWICPECGVNHDRDVNAVKNIKAVALTALAHGAAANPEAA
ncbi:zinc ribbon domain-containing protein [Klebsiella oxytoca]